MSSNASGESSASSASSSQPPRRPSVAARYTASSMLAESSSSIPPTEGSPSAFERWRYSLSQMTGLGLSDEEKAERSRRMETEKEAKEKSVCEKWKEELMKSSPAVTFMLRHLELSKCPFSSASIQCHPCPPTRSGGFSPDLGILLCQDRFLNKKHMEDTLVHEMIHAFDHCRFDVKWENLRHHACSEIRAANLSGDCRWTREVGRGFYAFSKQHQACVKRRAILSVQGNPACKSPEEAETAVNQVWESCFADTRPFDEIY